ncbi:VOC family protein [Rhodobacteraceae bacterium RKSG542]|uniref:VOC family protein n=1 Tax=Pseudovibrio flavus TaxID=2529854 RepID=UPI0012BD2298|nr:VOC family protein [Pseudovibrio flavus]MTI16551.1 VOC family protein [Pseudovibrio flavus]
MKLYGLRIFVDDLAAAKSFYTEALGLPLNWEMPHLHAFGVALDNAELIIELAQDEEEKSWTGRFVGASLEVDDIHKTHDWLRAAGVVFVMEPTKQEWGGVLAHFHDPAGNILTLLGTRQET